jgi:hypothetical protein
LNKPNYNFGNEICIQQALHSFQLFSKEKDSEEEKVKPVSDTKTSLILTVSPLTVITGVPQI